VANPPPFSTVPTQKMKESSVLGNTPPTFFSNTLIINSATRRCQALSFRSFLHAVSSRVSSHITPSGLYRNCPPTSLVPRSERWQPMGHSLLLFFPWACYGADEYPLDPYLGPARSSASISNAHTPQGFLQRPLYGELMDRVPRLF